MSYYRLDDYDYFISEDRIRKFPLQDRESSKLLVVDKNGNIISNTIFRNIIDFLSPSDLVVFNNSKVIKSRIYGLREKNNKIIEILIIKKLESNLFLALTKNIKSFKEGEKISILKKLGDKLDDKVGDKLEFTDYFLIVMGKEKDGLLLSFNTSLSLNSIEEFGIIPIPPYLKRESIELDEIYYQNVFAREKGSVASPTAGLHFTDNLIEKLEEKGIDIAFVTLHVGWGTFAPIRTVDVRLHNIHKEWYVIDEENAKKINNAKFKNKKVIACGTTSLRALEGCYLQYGEIKPVESETSIFIYPPYEFKVVDGLITNFHTPKSTLLLLVSAFAGYENIKKYYKYALENDYMFFSYGDAMFIKP